MSRTILIHLNVEVPDGDERAPEEIVAAIAGAISVGSDDESLHDLGVSIPLYEEV